MPRKKKSLDPRNFEGRSDTEILSIVTADMKRAENYQQPYFDKFAKFYKQYNCVNENERAEGANLFIPYIYNIIETALPKIIGSVFEAKPFLTYKPVPSATDGTAKADAMTNLVYFQMKQYMKASTRFYEIYKSALMYGTAISKQGWKYKEKSVMQRKMVEQEAEADNGEIVKISVRTPVRTTKTIYDAPEMKNVPIESFFFDPAYSEIDESPFAIHEYFKELHELKAGAAEGYYKNVDKISEEKQDGALKAKYDSAGILLGDMHQSVRIWEYWTDEWLVTIANKGTVIRVEENPYYYKSKPFVKWCCVVMPNEFYGKSMIETLMDLQSELNTIRNQRIDNVSLAINRMFLIQKGEGIDTTQLVSRPNGFIEVDDVEKSIKEMVVSDVTASAYQDEEVIKNDMDVTSGVHNQDRGQAGDRRETATVATLLSSASSERFRMQVMLLEEDPITELGRQLAELNKQFLEDDTYILIQGEDGVDSSVSISFDDIDAEFDIVASATSTDANVNKELRMGQLIQLLPVALNNANVNQPELLRQMFKEFGFKNFESMIIAQPTTEEVMLDENGNPIPTEEPAPEEAEGLYPQLGGVGTLGLEMQNQAV